METKAFKESSASGLKKTALVFLGIFLALVALTALNGFKDIIFLLVILGVFAFVLVITALSTAGQRHRTVFCRAEDCEIGSTNLWGSYDFEASFRWSDVTETEIVEKFHELADGGVLSNYFFEVVANDRVYTLWNVTKASGKTTAGLFAYVARAAPHLKYVWEKTADFGGRQVIIEVDKYSKVARK